jgi:NTP pyrophosphatase (non-canonical NTP hydrolase)
MSLRNVQQQVDEWISQFEEGYFAPLPMLARLTEEVGELARAIRKGDRDNLELEFSDGLAWTASLANLLDVDLEAVAGRYEAGCPKCGSSPCRCAR